MNRIDSASVSGGNGSDRAQFRYEFQSAKRRVVARYFGVWSEQTVRDALVAFHEVLEKARAGGQPFTLLDDFREWQVQSPQVTAELYRFEEVLRSFPIQRNAMVIPNAQIRMQVRRTLTDFHLSKIFLRYDEAEVWLAPAENDS